MKRSHGLLAVTGLAAAVVFAGCSDDPPANNNPGTAGSAGTPAGGAATAGTSTTAGTATAGTFANAGTDVGGMGGTAGTATAGMAGTATAGTGGTVPVVPIVPTVFLIDNIRLQPLVPSEGGAGGAGGANGADAGGAPAAEAGAPAVAVGGAAAGGAAGAGGADSGPLPDFFMPFDANVTGFAIHSDGFSPGQGDPTSPFIFDQTTLAWDATNGKTGGAAKVSVPFTVKGQQADFGGTFATPADLTGYELTADVKMTETGDVGMCATVWLYVYGGNGYANDKTGEPMMGVTSHLVKGEWSKVRLTLDGPYGYHSTANHPNFKPTLVNVWGAQFVTFGCP